MKVNPMIYFVVIHDEEKIRFNRCLSDQINSNISFFQIYKL